MTEKKKNPPYLTSTGSIVKCLERIRQAQTPEKVSIDFVTTKLDIKGGTGRALVPFLKKLGMVNTDGTPTDLYHAFRNPAKSGAAIASALKVGYRQLYEYNEYLHDLSHDDLKGVIVQATGLEEKSEVVGLIAKTFTRIKEMADFGAGTIALADDGDRDGDSNGSDERGNGEGERTPPPGVGVQAGGVGMNLSYTINLNLPATSDIAVFNAIFKSLKENLLKNG